MGRGKRGASSSRHALPLDLQAGLWRAEQLELLALATRPSIHEEEGKLSWQTLSQGVPMVTADKGLRHAFKRKLAAEGEWEIWVHLPGKHAEDSDGGDFGVEIVCSSKPAHVKGPWFPTHLEIFEDVAAKRAADPSWMRHQFGPALTAVLWSGHCPLDAAKRLEPRRLPGLEVSALLTLCQAIGLAEHRNYSSFEDDGEGGRYLPMKLIHGLLEGNWDIDKLRAVLEKKGKKGLSAGKPALWELRRQRFGRAKGKGLGLAPRSYLDEWQRISAAGV